MIFTETSRKLNKYTMQGSFFGHVLTYKISYRYYTYLPSRAANRIAPPSSKAKAQPRERFSVFSSSSIWKYHIFVSCFCHFWFIGMKQGGSQFKLYFFLVSEIWVLNYDDSNFFLVKLIHIFWKPLIWFDLLSQFHSNNDGRIECSEEVQNILESNSPQVLVLPVENDLNTFTSAQIRLR